jgi:hypothetical protein
LGGWRAGAWTVSERAGEREGGREGGEGGEAEGRGGGEGREGSREARGEEWNSNPAGKREGEEGASFRGAAVAWLAEKSSGKRVTGNRGRREAFRLEPGPRKPEAGSRKLDTGCWVLGAVARMSEDGGRRLACCRSWVVFPLRPPIIGRPITAPDCARDPLPHPLADHSAVNGRPLNEASGFPGHTPPGSGAGRPQASGFELQAACFETVAGVPSTWLRPLPPSMFPDAHWVW